MAAHTKPCDDKNEMVTQDNVSNAPPCKILMNVAKSWDVALNLGLFALEASALFPLSCFDASLGLGAAFRLLSCLLLVDCPSTPYNERRKHG